MFSTLAGIVLKWAAHHVLGGGVVNLLAGRFCTALALAGMVLRQRDICSCWLSSHGVRCSLIVGRLCFGGNCYGTLAHAHQKRALNWVAATGSRSHAFDTLLRCCGWTRQRPSIWHHRLTAGVKLDTHCASSLAFLSAVSAQGLWYVDAFIALDLPVVTFKGSIGTPPIRGFQ